MKGKYISEGRYTFYRIETESEFDGGFELRIMSGHQPEMLLKLHLSKEGRDTALNYNVSGLVSLASCAERSRAYLYGIIAALDRLGEILPEYLLSADQLDLDPESIFIRRETGQIYFCYIPGEAGNFPDGIQALMEYFLKTAEPESEEDVLLLYGLYAKSREKTVTPGTLAEFWWTQKASGKDKKQFKAEIPEISLDFPDSEIYTELGMEKSRLAQDKKQLPDNFVFSGEPVVAPEENISIVEEEQSEPEGAVRTDRAEAIRRVWTAHKTELIIAAVLIIGAILILFK